MAFPGTHVKHPEIVNDKFFYINLSSFFPFLLSIVEVFNFFIQILNNIVSLNKHNLLQSYLATAIMHPLRLPNVENATNMGMHQDISPNIFIANVCKTKINFILHVN